MGKQKTANTAAVWAGLLAIYVIWGSTYIANRLAVRTIPPFLMTGIRNFSAGAILFALRRFAGDGRPTKEQWKSAFLVGSLMLGGGSGLVAWSQRTVPSRIAALVVASVPLWMALLDILGGVASRHHRPRPIAAFGILFGFFGIVLLVGPSRLVGIEGAIDPFGAVSLVFGAFFWALGSLRSRNAVFPESRLLGSAMQMMGGGVGLLLMAGVTGEFLQFEPSLISGASFLSFLYLVLLGSLVGFSIYTWLLRSAPTTLVSTYAYANPVVALVLGFFLLGEGIGLRVLIASAIILVSVAVVTLSGGPRTPSSVRSRPG